MPPSVDHKGDEELQRAVLDLVERVIDLPFAEQSEIVKRLSRDNPVLQKSVLAMLRTNVYADSFLDAPAAEALAVLAPDGSPARPPRQRIGPYELVRRIGVGGMGHVYLARQRGDGYTRQVAVKIVKRGMDTDAVLARFRLERHILASLNHPAIAKLIDAGTTDDGLAYFVMEYVDGIPITKFADKNRLSLEDRLSLHQKVCSAVHYAHRNLVVHRDIKPSNILVTEDGHVKLLDFGIAKLLNEDLAGVTVPHTSADVQFLTPEYASPEHIRREPISTASDVYSLGVLLYELLTGHRPFALTSRSYSEVVRAVCHTEPTRPSYVVSSAGRATGPTGAKVKVAPDELAMNRCLTGPGLVKALTGDLDTIVLKSIRKRPDDRYASAEQLREDIGRFLKGLPILARRASKSYRLRKFYSRNRALSIALTAGTVLFLALTAGWIYTLSHERNQAKAALERAENVKAFMVNVLSQGSVGSSTDDKKTSAALALVTPALAELEQTVGDDKATTVAILNIAGNLLAMNTAITAADSVLRRALYIGQTEVIPAEDRLETEFQLGVLLFQRSERDSSRSYLRRAYDGRRRLFGDQDERTLDAMKWYAWSVGQEANPELFSSVIRHFEQKYGQNSLNVAELLSDIGQGAKDLSYLERSLTIYKQHEDLETNSGAAGVMASLALGIEATDPERSLELTQQSVDILERTLGRYHEHTLTASNNLAAMYYDRSLYPLADSMLTDIAARRDELIPGSSLSSASGLYYRALTKQGLQMYPEAEQLFRNTLKVLSVEHPMYSTVVRYTATTIGQQGRKKDASAMLRIERQRLMSASVPDTTMIKRVDNLLERLK